MGNSSYFRFDDESENKLKNKLSINFILHVVHCNDWYKTLIYLQIRPQLCSGNVTTHRSFSLPDMTALRHWRCFLWVPSWRTRARMDTPWMASSVPCAWRRDDGLGHAWRVHVRRRHNQKVVECFGVGLSRGSGMQKVCMRGCCSGMGHYNWWAS